jgi:hypothetical protein
MNGDGSVKTRHAGYEGGSYSHRPSGLTPHRPLPCRPSPVRPPCPPAQVRELLDAPEYPMFWCADFILDTDEDGRDAYR